jgi:ABC-type Na+ transport system ATPase subunit NatA
MELIAPFSLTLESGGHARLSQPSDAAAKIAARIAAAIVKPTCGSVFIGDFDARLQPPQAKRLVGFVQNNGFEGSLRTFAREIKFRAQVWNLDLATLERNAAAVLTALEDLHPDYARTVALALAPDVELIVLESPTDDAFERIAALRPDAAMFSTNVASAPISLSPLPDLAVTVT